MVDDPLFLDPIRPELATDGSLANPIGGPDVIPLDASVPLRYADLLPSRTYADRGFEYLTDQGAMPARVRGVLERPMKSEVIRHRGVQTDIGRLGAGDGRWQGGHIVAVSLGGFASGPNLFPQSGNFNQSSFARLENGWRSALSEGVTVGVDIALTEGADARIPEFVIVTYWEDETEETIPFLNEPGVQ